MWRRERPVDPGLEDGVSRIRSELQRPLEELLRFGERSLVDERVREQDRKPHALDRVVAPFGGLERFTEDRVGRIEVVQHRVGAAERVGPGRMVGELVRHDSPRLLEPADRLVWIPLAEGKLAEAGKRSGPFVGVCALLQAA